LQAETTFTDSISSISIVSAAFSVAVNSCSAAITITCGGNNSPITLSSSSTGGKFYLNAANCASQTSPITSDGTSCNPPDVFYRDSIAGNPTITVTANGNIATQSETIFGPATKLVFTNTPVTVTAGVCSSAFTIVSQDANGNASTVTSTETLTPSASPAAGATFYTDASCTTAVTGSNLTIATESNTVNLFFKDTNPGSVLITMTGAGGFTANGVNAATQTETVNANIVRRGQTITATLWPNEQYILLGLR
jgi:hypothetical protein